jgi:competence ComEA-like helix-hairpin-helix protein
VDAIGSVVLMTSDRITGRGESSGGGVESVAFVLLAWLCVTVAIPSVVNTTRISTGHAFFEIEDRVNPNYASSVSLARLPRIGPARAQEIVSYRRRFTEQAGQSLVFKRVEDLQRIKGIGPATIEAVRPWLSFDPVALEAPSASQTVPADSEANSLK